MKTNRFEWNYTADVFFLALSWANFEKDLDKYDFYLAHILRAACTKALPFIRVRFNVTPNSPTIDEAIPAEIDPNYFALILHDLNNARQFDQERIQEMIVCRTDFMNWIEKTEFWPLDPASPIRDWLAPEIANRVNNPKTTGGRTENLPKSEHPYRIWLFERWIELGKPNAPIFFQKLKKFVNTPGSPIIAHHIDGADAGIRLRTSSGHEFNLAKKTLSNTVSLFKRRK